MSITNNNFIRWATQSISSMGGSGVFNRGAQAAANKADRATRNINRDVWTKVSAQIDQDARRGMYFGCYAIPRAALGEQGGNVFNRGFGSALKRRGFFAMYDKHPNVGSKLYSDVAIFWGHKSRKLRSNTSFQLYGFDLLANYFAECIGHGLNDVLAGQGAKELMQEFVGKMAKQADFNASFNWFADNIESMVAMVAFKPDIPCVMDFHVQNITQVSRLAQGIQFVLRELMALGPSTQATNLESVKTRLIELQSELKGGHTEQILSSLQLVRDLNLGRADYLPATT